MLPRTPRRRLVLLVVPLWALVLVAAHARAEPIPSPEQFFGFRMGADGRLADWTRTVDYFHLVDRLSTRVTVQSLGPTTDGRPFLLAIVSAPDTLASLPRYQAMQRALVDPATSAQELTRIEHEGKVVVVVGASVHANEIGSAQMMNDLVYELATSDADWVQRVLRDSIVLLIPSQNPDGLQQTAEWFRKNAGTPYEDAPLPDLYQRYAGHDNNRDSYMLTQPESQYLAKVLYRDWMPEVYLDQHQMGSGRARIFVPPYTNPPNPNIDPLVWSETNLLGQAMAARLHEAGKPGVLWGEIYSGFWQGANSTNPWWHNMVGLLSEVASARLASPLFQQRPSHVADTAHQTLTDDDDEPMSGDAVIPPPADLQPRMNYPQPWLGGRWTFADVVDYHHLAAAGLLEAAAGHRAQLVRGFAAMNRRTIDRFSSGGPFAFIVPGDQHDARAAAQLVRLVQAGGGRVQRASAPFVADGTHYPAGTTVIPLAQPFGRWIKDLLEAQSYPDARWPSPSAPIDRPYDMTAWSLGMLMGVSLRTVEHPFEAALATLDADQPLPRGRVSGTGPIFLMPHESNTSLTATARLLAEGAEISWARSPVKIAGRTFAAGVGIVRGVPLKRMVRLADELGIDVVATDREPDVPVLTLREPRVALYEPWGGTTDAGWTRWVLDQHDVRYTQIRGTGLHDDAFVTGYDVLVVPEASDAQLLRGLVGSGVRPEHRGGIGEDGLVRLRTFVEQGGTIVALGNSSQVLVDRLGLPLTHLVADLPQETYFCPGSILALDVDTSHPIGFGMPEAAHAMVVGNAAYIPGPRAAHSVTTVAHYPQQPLLESGWMVGDTVLRGASAVLDVRVGRGHIILLTFRTQHRGQTLGTFKLLLNAIFYGAAVQPATPPSQTQQF